MLRSLAVKELRELLPLLAVALVAQVYLLCTAMGMRLDSYLEQSTGIIPFAYDSSAVYFFVAAGVTAVALGLWQTLWETNRGTFQFLLHRPTPRNSIFAAKLALGLALSFVVALLPTVAYALWAAAPRTHASPFEWSMTDWAWQQCALTPLLYLGAFLSGLRPGRWFGSRFLPLAAGVAVYLLLEMLVQTFSLPVWPAVLVSLLVAVCFILAILHVAATRDFS